MGKRPGVRGGIFLRMFRPKTKEGLNKQANWKLNGRVLTETVSPIEKGAWIWHLKVSSTAEAVKSLNHYGHTRARTTKIMHPPKMIVVENVLNDASLFQKYLTGVQSVSAQVLEQHRDILATKSKDYAHRNAGMSICHFSPHLYLEDLEQGLDVDQTRLALSADNLSTRSKEMPCDTYDTILETIVQNTDVLMINDAAIEGREAWRQVWEAQRIRGCLETYAVCKDQKVAQKIKEVSMEYNRETRKRLSEEKQEQHQTIRQARIKELEEKGFKQYQKEHGKLNRWTWRKLFDEIEQRHLRRGGSVEDGWFDQYR